MPRRSEAINLHPERGISICGRKSQSLTYALPAPMCSKSSNKLPYATQCTQTIRPSSATLWPKSKNMTIKMVLTIPTPQARGLRVLDLTPAASSPRPRSKKSTLKKCHSRCALKSKRSPLGRAILESRGSAYRSSWGRANLDRCIWPVIFRLVSLWL